MTIDGLVKEFLPNWRRTKGNFDLATFCELCGDLLVDGNFALIDGILVCLRCKEKIPSPRGSSSRFMEDKATLASDLSAIKTLNRGDPGGTPPLGEKKR